MEIIINNLKKTNEQTLQYLSKFVNHILLSKIFLGLLITCYFISLYINGSTIKGPFIFGDELVYFSFARDIFFRNNIDIYPQYGPLYPTLISFSFILNSIISSYKFVKTINIISFCSTIIPAYILSKKLFENPSCRFIFIIISLVTPFTGNIHLIMGEALYYPLFFWTCVCLINFFENPNYRTNFLFCLILSSLYYTKPPPGLITMIGGILTIVFHGIWIEKKDKKYIFSTLLFCLLFITPWLIHYHKIGASIIGYTSNSVFQEQFLKSNSNSLILEIIQSYFYQYTYVIYASFGTLPTLILISRFFYKKSLYIEKSFIFFILISLLGLFFLCALGVSTHPALNFRMPQGRYYSMFIPFILIFLMNKLMNSDLHSKKLLIIGLISNAVILGFIITCPPFVVSNPVAYTSMGEESIILYFINNKQLLWKPLICIPPFSQTLNLSLILCAINSLILLLNTKFKTYLIHVIAVMIMTISFYNTALENASIKILGESQNALNTIYREFIDQNIPVQNITIDASLKDGNTQFMSSFWFNKNIPYISVEQFKKIESRKPSYFWTKEKLNFPIFYKNDEYTVYVKSQN
jgi:hypothetical protein